MMDEVDSYFNYVMKNNKKYFKFKQFSQIETFGDKLVDKPEGVIRIWFENVNGLPIGNRGEKHDYRHLTHIFNRCSIDIFGAAETKTNFSCVDSKNSLNERLFQYDPLTPVRTATSQNTHEKLGKRQWGGTCTIARGEITDRVFETGIDTSGLGRWSWIKLRGNDGTVTRFISTYQPCIQRNKRCYASTYIQWQRFFGIQEETPAVLK